MTTDTAPLIEHAVSIDELPALDQHDERTCQMLYRPHPDGEPCGKPAMWAVTFHCDQPEHDRTEMVLLCDGHLGLRMRCSACWVHGGIRRNLHVTRVEPLR